MLVEAAIDLAEAEFGGDVGTWQGEAPMENVRVLGEQVL